eukprot:7592342-Pyramimonas_sp.AAC.1
MEGGSCPGNGRSLETSSRVIASHKINAALARTEGDCFAKWSPLIGLPISYMGHPSFEGALPAVTGRQVNVFMHGLLGMVLGR